MKHQLIVSASLVLATSAVTLPALAHHSAYAFDTERTVVVAGTVTEWFWANPHCLLKFDAVADNGDVVHWVTETQAPANMVDAGWRKNDLKPGDLVTVTLQPARNGNSVGRIVRVEFSDGRVLDVSQDRSGATGNEYHLSGAPTD